MEKMRDEELVKKLEQYEKVENFWMLIVGEKAKKKKKALIHEQFDAVVGHGRMVRI